MFMKGILVVLCLLAHNEGVVQPRTLERNVSETFMTLISDNMESETKKCNITFSNETFALCNYPLLSKITSRYFDYEHAVCITLYDSLERLCNLRKLSNTHNKLELEESSLTVKNVSAFCNKMKSTVNGPLYETEVSERKEWMEALKDGLSDGDMGCRDACIHGGKQVNPICSILLQINAHLTFILSEKHNTSDVTGGAETNFRNKNQDVQVVSTNQKAASDVNHEGTQVEPNGVPVSENMAPDVHHGQQDKVSLPQEGENNQGLTLTENVHKKTEKIVSTISDTEQSGKDVKKENILPEKEINAAVKQKLMNKKSHKDTTALKEDKNKLTSNVSVPVTNKPTSLKTEEIDESKVSKQLPSNPNKTNEKPAVNEIPSDEKEKDKGPGNKPIPVTGETKEKAEKPLPNPEDDIKETNIDKPTIDGKENNKEPEQQSSVEVPKDKNSDVKTENLPKVSQDSKAQNSDKSKVAVDSSTKLSSPKTEDVIEPAQPQSPDPESEITDKDQTMFDGNEETGEQNLGENQDPIDVDGPNNMASEDDDDDVDDKVVQKISKLPEMDEGTINNPGRGPFIRDKFVNAEDSHFFAYFMTMVIICIIGYLVYHNKQKILALALEGRSRRSTRRRPNTSGYRKLDSNLEEAVTSACSTSVTHVIY